MCWAHSKNFTNSNSQTPPKNLEVVTVIIPILQIWKLENRSFPKVIEAVGSKDSL